jgi:hypothetical protein
MEFRCFPSDSGVGLNSFDISLAINSSALPNFRAFSTGGLNTGQTQIIKDPDLEVFPTGGFNPTSTPPGAPTARAVDNTFYIGQLDVVIRVSRVHSIWFNTQTTTPSFVAPISEPKPEAQPSGTSVQLEFRGATGFSGTDPADAPFGSEFLDAYGELGDQGTVQFLNGVQTWTSDVTQVSGARYVQLRASFFNNIETNLNPELSGFGLAWEE